jgi:hypothetical protein
MEKTMKPSLVEIKTSMDVLVQRDTRGVRKIKNVFVRGRNYAGGFPEGLDWFHEKSLGPLHKIVQLIPRYLASDIKLIRAKIAQTVRC